VKQRKSRIKPYLVESFINKRDQVINPGDAIIIVSSHYKQVSVETGRYLGKRLSGTYDGKPQFNVVVEVDLVRNKTVRKDDETKEWNWNYDKIPGLILPPELSQPEYPRINKFGGWNQSRSPEGQAEMDNYNKQMKLVRERRDERSKLAMEFKEKYYKNIQIPYTKISTLQLNRIFPINLGLDALRGSSF
jgi:hypothetical protein